MNKPWKIFGIDIKWIILLLLVGGGICVFRNPGKRYPAGVLIPSTPQMEKISQMPPWSYQSKAKKYTLTARKSYAAEARVLSVNREYGDSMIGPLDIVIGWGPMSDQKVLDQIKIWQDNTRHWYCSPRGSDWPIPRQEVALHAVNTHIIPASPEIENQLKEIRKGDLIDIQGYLVDVSGEGGFSWRTSVDPMGFGEHSCKIIWVERINRR